VAFTLLTVIFQSSKGCLKSSSIALSNSKISSKNKTHLCASDISQGQAFLHHHIILAGEAVWWTVLKGLFFIIGLVEFNKPEILYILETSIASSIIKSGNIVANDLDNIVFHEPGGQSIMILCHHDAATSKALFACSCHKTYLKSYLFSHILLYHKREYFLKSNCSIMFKSLFQFNISIASSKDSTSITSIHGIIDASRELVFGTNILLNHFSFAQIVAGKIEATFLRFQSSDNSQIKIESLIKLLLIYQPFKSIHIAIGKSKLGQDFLISAGAKLTVILFIGNLFPDDFNADFILSLLSCTH
jgi:hypothetical protein